MHKNARNPKKFLDLPMMIKKTVKKIEKKTAANPEKAKKPAKKTDDKIPAPAKKAIAVKTAAENTPKAVTDGEHSKPIKIRKYYEAVGRRKNAVARVRISPIKTNEMRAPFFSIKEKKAADYFRGIELQSIIEAPFKLMKMVDKFDVTVVVRGGGIHSQAEAVRLGISRALLEFNKTFRKKLKRAGFLERDSRKKERKKPGLKKARRAPQWQKR